MNIKHEQKSKRVLTPTLNHLSNLCIMFRFNILTIKREQIQKKQMIFIMSTSILNIIKIEIYIFFLVKVVWKDKYFS